MLVNPPKNQVEDHMSKRKRQHFTSEEKFNIVKQILSRARTVSEITDEYGVHPNQFYRGQVNLNNEILVIEFISC